MNFIKAMPQKDITSVNEDAFAMDRRNYIKTLPTADTTYINPQKKWYGNRAVRQGCLQNNNFIGNSGSHVETKIL